MLLFLLSAFYPHQLHPMKLSFGASTSVTREGVGGQVAAELKANL